MSGKRVRSKVLRLTCRQVGYIRCFLYPRLRVSGDEERRELGVILHKLERLWKEPLYTGVGEVYVPPVISKVTSKTTYKRK